MKNLLLLALIGLLLNCDNTKVDCPKPPTCGDFMALLNQQEWTAAPTATYFATGRDSANVMIEECSAPCNRGEVEWLSLNRIPLSPGTYSLNRYQWGELHATPISAWFYTVIGGDVTGERYNLMTKSTEKNQLTIDSYNPTTREIQARLSATFVIDPESDSPERSRPDTIRIREATFSVTVSPEI